MVGSSGEAWRPGRRRAAQHRRAPDEWRGRRARDSLSLLSPVTTPCRVVAQAVNYRWRVFFSRQERNPAYLKAGDVVTASIATEDETLDLGAQRIVVRDER
jgi:hypothetical protein